MANRIHSLAIQASRAGWDAAGENPAGAAAGYALFADRGHSTKAAPADYALVAKAAVPKGPLPPQYALSAERKRSAAEARRGRWPYRALAAALALHLAILVILIVRPIVTPTERGLEDGVPQTLNVGIISSADLKRLSSDPYRQEGNAPSNELAALPQEEQIPSPPQPQEPTPPEPAPVPEASSNTFDASAFAEMASRQFSAQLNQAFKMAEARRDRQQQHQQQQQPSPRKAALRVGNIEAMRPGATHVGKSDEFARDVIWALNGNKPMSNGKWGITIVTFTVSAAGHVEGLTMIKSSGDKWLDTAALMSVRHTHMPSPPPGLPTGDRTFVIRYISEQSG